MMDPRQRQAYVYARHEIGAAEIAGPRHNPEILGWFGAVGHAWVRDDETAWCAAFAGAMLERAGLPSTRALNARSYLDWGEAVPLPSAQEGDIVVFWRVRPDSWQGHVGFLSEVKGDRIMVLGGNQGNEVSVAPYPVSRLLGVRRISAPAVKAPAIRPPAFRMRDFFRRLGVVR